MRHFILIISLVLLWSCNEDEKKLIEEQKELIHQLQEKIGLQKGDIINKNEIIEKYEKVTNIKSHNLNQPQKCYFNQSQIKPTLRPPIDIREYIYDDSTHIYCAPDTDSEILFTLKFGSTSSINDFFYYKNEAWCRVSGSHPNYNEPRYIKAKAFSDYLMGNSKHQLEYLGKIKSESSFNGYFEIKRCNSKTKEISHIYKTDEYYKYHGTNYMYNHTLKNVKFMMHFWTEFDECPGAYHEEIIVDVNGKLVQLWKNGYVGSEGEEDESGITNEFNSIYIPVETVDGIKLSPRGKSDYELEQGQSFITYDESLIQVPIQDLIITEKTIRYKNESEKTTTSYHQWTGDSLVFIKSEIIEH